MWLLTTDRAELQYFARPPKRYAILSHVWQKERPGQHGSPEQSFQDLRNIAARCARTGQDPRALLSPKIRNCCKWAAEHGFRHVWIDTCCIDKTSSAELSEAINSMFAWYCLATICYAFLYDVSIAANPLASDSAFRRSKWFTRGWTLQELIAPKDVVFLSKEWAPITSKRAEPRALQQITGIDYKVLLGERSLSEVSAAERMSWAAERRTTRVEDQAYCLMGLFNVNMPTIYGEGKDAFLRLQDEIMKRGLDHSLLVWGHSLDLNLTVLGFQTELYPSAHDTTAISESCMYASNATVFADSADVRTITLQELTSLHHIEKIEIPQVSPTNYGIHLRLPVIYFPNYCSIALVPCQVGDMTVGLVIRFQGAGVPFAVGNGIVVSDPRASNIGQCSHFDESGQQLPSCRHLQQVRYTLVPPYGNYTFSTESRPPVWQDIYLAFRPEHVRIQTRINRIAGRAVPAPGDLDVYTFGSPHNSGGDGTSRSIQNRPVPLALVHKVFLPPWVIARLASHGFDLMIPANERAPLRELRNGDKFILAFGDSTGANRNRFVIHMEHSRYTLSSDNSGGGRIFCTVQFWEVGSSRPRVGSDGKSLVSGDFVDVWDGRWKEFGDNAQSLLIRFLRMGEMRGTEREQCSRCQVYQLDILLPRKQVRI